MAYTAPYIDSAGLHIPTYADILADMIAQFQTIYPQVVYLAPSTAKYQDLSITALKIYDTMLAAQLAYNARSPLTAIGSDLDSIVKLNGIARKAASYSTALGVVSGVSGTVITAGTVTDTSGYIWALPATVTIPSTGSIVVTVTCQTAGAIQAGVGSINTMSGGTTAGWTGFTNTSAASAGTAVETDSQLRARQSISVAIPSITRLAATLGAIAAVSGVTRYNPGAQSVANTGSSIENFTGATDEWGNPPHSISMVVEGGTDLDVSTAIFSKRGLGVYTNPNATANPSGTRSISVTDANTNVPMVIGFQRPSYVSITVAMTVKGLNGFSSAVQAAIQTAIVSYLNSLQIGEELTFSSIYAVAQSVMPSLILPQFSITSLQIGRTGGAMGTTDLPMAYYEVTEGVAEDVTITVA